MPFGVEVMGRVRELGTVEDVFAIAARLRWVRPVIDFAHLHATSDGALHRRGPRSRTCSSSPTSCSSPARRSTSTSPTSRTRTATRRSTSPTATARCARSRWRGARALRAAGHGDQRVARRGVAPGDPRRAARASSSGDLSGRILASKRGQLGQARFEGSCFPVATALAVEAGRASRSSSRWCTRKSVCSAPSTPRRRAPRPPRRGPEPLARLRAPRSSSRSRSRPPAPPSPVKRGRTPPPRRCVRVDEQLGESPLRLDERRADRAAARCASTPA